VGRSPDGRVVFVPATVPGDRVRVRIEKQLPRFARGRVERLLEPGAARVEPRCPAYGRCGGCTWQHVDYSAQLEAKQHILSDALARIGGISLAELPLVHPSPRAYAYRSRARVLVERGRVGYRERASHRLCAVESCPELEAKLAELASAPPAHDGEWELASASGEVRASPLPAEAEVCGPSLLELRVAGERLRFSPGVFSQANTLLLETMLGRVGECVGSGEELVELFAGSGLFTLPLARRFGRVVAVESNPAAAADLKSNLARAGLSNARVLCGRVEESRQALAGLRPEAVLLDPPRVGLAAEGVELVTQLAPERVAYLSCDPATLARDLRALCSAGYRLASVEGFDLFPQTHHLEALVVLQKA
jgi:23S rRNA (uracil1939-C5)-methyltransferase